MRFDPSEDFECFDGLKAATFTPCDGTDPVDLERVLRRAVTTREAAKSNGQYTTNDSVFHVATSEYPTKLPLGSTITDFEDRNWEVLECAKQTLNTRWRIIARELQLLAKDSTIEVWHEIARYEKGSSGAQCRVWERQPEPMRAKFQPIEEERRVENESVHSPERFYGYFEEDFDAEHNHRWVVLDDGGNITIDYSYVKSMGRESIGELFKIECLETKWPLG